LIQSYSLIYELRWYIFMIHQLFLSRKRWCINQYIFIPSIEGYPGGSANDSIIAVVHWRCAHGRHHTRHCLFHTFTYHITYQYHLSNHIISFNNIIIIIEKTCYHMHIEITTCEERSKNFPIPSKMCGWSNTCSTVWSRPKPIHIQSGMDFFSHIRFWRISCHRTMS